jgi:DNA (cytosine-5)-methyltransferase 1
MEDVPEGRKVKKKEIKAADLFCGAGGTSQGLLMAANEIGADLSLVAVNHWQVAIDTHSINHPYAQHACTGIDNVDPRKLIPGGRLDVMCASPECTHHSVARGGKPMSDQSRSSAWHVLRFAEALYIDNIILENVPEFTSWGPLGANGRPLKSKRGELFLQFVSSLKALGYRVEWRILTCADYGDPTTRRRLFIIARRGGKQIHWPKPTHTRLRNELIPDQRQPWRTAREIIDWKMDSQSIFDRKRPLAKKTLSRIQAGLKRFCGLDIDLGRCVAENLRPFLVVMRGTGTTQAVDEPLHTVTAGGNHYGLVEPYLVQWDQQGSDSGKNRGIDEPIPTVVTKANTGIVQPFLLPHPRKNDQPQSIDKPVRTVTATSCDLSLVEPFLMQAGGPEGKGREPRSVGDPLATVVTENHTALIQPYMVTVNHGEGETPRAAQSVDEPMPTATSKIGVGICEPFLICYYGTENLSGAADPVPTVTTKERFALIQPEVKRYRLDIRFRMLQPRELARAQGFPDHYRFTGKRDDIVKQIGNAVPTHTAKALVEAVIG